MGGLTSRRLGGWLALLAALQAGSGTLPEVCPPWVGQWVTWAVAALSAGTAAYVAWSKAVTLPADGSPRRVVAPAG